MATAKAYKSRGGQWSLPIASRSTLAERRDWREKGRWVPPQTPRDGPSAPNLPAFKAWLRHVPSKDGKIFAAQLSRIRWPLEEVSGELYPDIKSLALATGYPSYVAPPYMALSHLVCVDHPHYNPNAPATGLLLGSSKEQQHAPSSSSPSPSPSPTPTHPTATAFLSYLLKMQKGGSIYSNYLPRTSWPLNDQGKPFSDLRELAKWMGVEVSGAAIGCSGGHAFELPKDLSKVRGYAPGGVHRKGVMGVGGKGAGAAEDTTSLPPSLEDPVIVSLMAAVREELVHGTPSGMPPATLFSALPGHIRSTSSLAVLLKVVPRMPGVLTVTAPGETSGEPEVALFMLNPSYKGKGGAASTAAAAAAAAAVMAATVVATAPAVPTPTPSSATASTTTSSGAIVTPDGRTIRFPAKFPLAKGAPPSSPLTTASLASSAKGATSSSSSSGGGVGGGGVEKRPSTLSPFSPPHTSTSTFTSTASPAPFVPTMPHDKMMETLAAAVDYFMDEQSSLSILELMREIKKNMPKMFLQLGNTFTVKEHLKELSDKFEVFGDATEGWNVRRVEGRRKR